MRKEGQKIIDGIAVSAENLVFAASVLAAKEKKSLRDAVKSECVAAAKAVKDATEKNNAATERFRVADKLASAVAMDDNDVIRDWTDALKDVIPDKDLVRDILKKWTDGAKDAAPEKSGKGK